jgi:hypothetical protein
MFVALAVERIVKSVGVIALYAGINGAAMMAAIDSFEV